MDKFNSTPEDIQATATVLRELRSSLLGLYAHHSLRDIYGIADPRSDIDEELGQLIQLTVEWHGELLEDRFRLLADGKPQHEDELVVFTQQLFRVLFAWVSSTISEAEELMNREQGPEYNELRFLIACYIWPLYRFDNHAKLGQEYNEHFEDTTFPESGTDNIETAQDAIQVANTLSREFEQEADNIPEERREEVLAAMKQHLPTLYEQMLQSLVDTAEAIQYDLLTALESADEQES